MSTHSNVDQVAATIAKLADFLDFTRKGATSSLGKDIADRMALNISDRARNGDGLEGEFPENRGDYGKRKRKVGKPVGVGLKDTKDRMLSIQELKGDVDIKKDSVTIAHGTNEETEKRGQWFTAGSKSTPDAERSGAKNQPPRPFYGITSEDEDDILDITSEAAEEFIKSL